MIQGPTDEAVPKWLGVAHCLLENVCKNVLYTNYSFNKLTAVVFQEQDYFYYLRAVKHFKCAAFHM